MSRQNISVIDTVKENKEEKAGFWQQTFERKDAFNPCAEITTD